MALISVTDAAEKYDLSKTQIRRLVSGGTLKGQRIGNAWGVNERSLQAYLATERRRGPKPKRRPART